MSRPAIRDTAQDQIFLTKHGIIVPPSDAAVANLTDYIRQPDVIRRKVPEARRVTEIKKMQATWINQQVIEHGTGRHGIVRYLMTRRMYSNSPTSTMGGATIFLAIVSWESGSCGRGQSLHQLTLVSQSAKPLTKASS